jgi:membrane-associated phospholipid phosphatase
MRRVKIWGIAFGLMILAVAICYVAVDRPLVLFVHERLTPFNPFFVLLTRIPEPFPVIATLIVVGLGLRSLTGRRLAKPHAVALLWSLSLLVTTAINRQLKFALGRTWPETWVNNNPSFIRDGAYGFNPFHGGAGFEAFPSGHMAAICVAAVVLWFCYSRLRAVYGLLVVTVAIGLIGTNYHFLSDVIAGGFVGVSIGYFAIALWEAGGQPGLRSEKIRPRGKIRKAP